MDLRELRDLCNEHFDVEKKRVTMDEQIEYALEEGATNKTRLARAVPALLDLFEMILAGVAPYTNEQLQSVAGRAVGGTRKAIREFRVDV